MSIIHQALKKVQENLNKQEPNTVTNTNPQETPNKTNASNPLLVFIVLPILMIAAGYLLFTQIKTYFPNTFKNITLPIPQKTKTTKTTTAKPIAASPAETKDNDTPTLPRLEGIMTHNGQHVALINGQIYQMNEKIDGVTITAINTNGVTLDNNGQVTVLTLKN